MENTFSLSTVPPLAGVRRLFFAINGWFLLIVGALAALGDLLAYYFGIGPLGSKLFEQPYAVGFFVEHGLMAFFGALLLTMARRELTPGWHLAAAGLHLFGVLSIVLFWQAAVAWDIVGPELAIGTLELTFAVIHLVFYWLVKDQPTVMSIKSTV